MKPRKKKGRFLDVKKVGPSWVIPKEHGESDEERHERRLKRNYEKWRELEDWALERGFLLRIKNGIEHWMLTGQGDHDGLVVHWWPRTAKLVINHCFPFGVHTHDWMQAGDILDQLLKWLAKHDPNQQLQRGFNEPLLRFIASLRARPRA